MKQLFFLVACTVGLVEAQKSSAPTPPKGTEINDIPILGLGTARISGNTSEVIASAIVNGFRHIDCAFMYGNQKEIGIGIQEGLKRTGLSRKDLWITSKLGNDRYVFLFCTEMTERLNSLCSHGREDFAINETLDQLGLDYLDLFLIHWPQRKVVNGSFDHVEV
jgi:alcohol dehydrogenase (NADP+)